jgi:hypothetical protein
MLERVMPDSPLGRRISHSPWPIEELVRAQRMACEGMSFDAIAQALGRPAMDVRRRLDPEPVAGRKEFASVGYPHFKGR